MLSETLKQHITEDRIIKISSGQRILSTQDNILDYSDLSTKERALRFNGFIVTDDSGRIVFEDRKRYSQHFYPLSVLDYAIALYQFERKCQPIPILSVDSHDVLECDFRCQDCLSAHGTKFPVSDFPKDNFKMDLETYKYILREIVKYSKKRGFDRVRFEQSGEGNPDCYLLRKKILAHAREIGMQSVYVTTGSQMGEDLIESLVENSSFIRISFPGIGESYEYYSGQKVFSFFDAMNRLADIIKERDRQGRQNDLMIGARVALRINHSRTYFDFAEQLKSMGVDTLQIVKILVPEGKKPSNFPLTTTDVLDLERTMSLDNIRFNVNIPHNLDSYVYSRNIENREEFPNQCFSARFQPVLAGRSLFVCTISNIMYSHNLRLGTFENQEAELERFLSPKNLARVTERIPARCKSCSNIYDNVLLSSLQKLFLVNRGELKFYEVLR